MAHSLSLDEVKNEIRSCIISSKAMLTLKQLSSDYMMLVGDPIPFKNLGFQSLEGLIKSFPDLDLKKQGNVTYAVAKQSEKSAHISELISNQKSPKKRPKFGRFHHSFPPSRSHQTNGWRPKTKYQSNKNHNPSGARAKNHAQFVSRSQPTVASKVVIPQHSSLPKQILRVEDEPATKGELNQRTNNKRLQENIKALSNSGGKEYMSKHRNTVFTTNTNINNNDGALQSTQIDSGASSKLLLSTKMRLSRKMSELSLDSDSGNSSPTNESISPILSKTAEFSRTNDPLKDLKKFVAIHKLGDVAVSTTLMDPKRKKFYSCKIKVGSEHTYCSYPKEFKSALEAQSFCCEEALADLIPKCEIKASLISTEQDLLIRIPPMLEKHANGIWAKQLTLDYSDKYGEMLPHDWLSIIDKSNNVHIEKTAKDHILYHCKLGDPNSVVIAEVLQKGQQRIGGSRMPLSNVSVPANTVQFREDGKLTCQITYVVSANEIWCEQIYTEENTRFSEMVDRMKIYYEEHEAQLIPQEIVLAGYYIAKYEQEYYRVRVEKIDQRGIVCFFIDTGDELVVPKSNIFVLERVYATSQAQAFLCRLSGLEDLYDVSTNSEHLAALLDRVVILELAIDISGDENTAILPVYMYDFETGSSINEDLISQLTVELAAPILKPDRSTEVYISHIESNGDIYVHVKTKGFDNLQSLRVELQMQVNEKPLDYLLYTVTKVNSEGQLYFMKDKLTGNWERTKLIDWAPTGDYAQVYFVDKGYTDVIKVADETLYPLDSVNEVFNTYPSQAVRVRMALDAIPPNFLDLATAALPKETPVLLKIVEMGAENIPTVKLFRRNADGLFCINESIAMQTELSKEETLKNKFKLLAVSGIPSTGTLKCPPLPKAGPGSRPIEVFVPMAVSPYNFIVQPCSSYKQLHEMMDKLQLAYEDVQYGNLSIDDIVPGGIYAYKHTDSCWYRLSVIKVIHTGSSVSGYLCDYGSYQTLSVRQLVTLDEAFMELPYQALSAKLAGIKPKLDKWTMVDCEFFKQLTEMKRLYAELISIERDSFSRSDIILKVSLYDTSTDDDILISDELIKSGIAVKHT
ncbi:tudor domain-containing protein 7B isoform X1 [Dendroctonus ponderosae]|uniref:tudor domain-containing protein 7B isoform X1 n=1 Tax=Dendroctonus ponderosae TaxID=77166 RepID=UPI0020358F68|nr:tudor domain-containing protein 7B isoform X1 [Dendroctonus ponderosae]XP_019769661.2 tudor domain-containing protein 7B isoform X1 [Dendroctonus ponderosae]XP_019769662.2 tudor domain-containing protein 7B isoform X1 [Dendroctonus ponderosae]XP_019769663.2 tudor domain-containing protein 7B isoform X1 [Dendroctonus ponderosae]